MRTIKNLVWLAFMTASIVCVNAQAIRRSPYKWMATLRVVDERTQPVAGAEVTIGFSTASSEGEPLSDKITGLTDTNGLFNASHTDRSVYLGFHVRKKDHYPTWVQHEIGFSPQDHPERLKPDITLILKRILNPIPMYAKWIDQPPTVLNKPLGYDLTAGDWVSPYGKGIKTDISFMARREHRQRDDFDYTLVVSFPNRGDGIQEFTVPRTRFPSEGSVLRSPHEAPAEGYRPEWVQTRTQGGASAKTGRDRNRNYFFRVQTVLDENGNVKSALYGKIYGDFMQFRYYLNPTVNDRNVEFDPKRNLLKGLKSTEKVDAP